MKSKRLILVQRYKWLQVLVMICCLLNLGPIFFIVLRFLIERRSFQKLYASDAEVELDRQQIQIAESLTKTKEALCENLPMLIIMSFKMALSSKVSLLEVLSSASSACLLARMIISYFVRYHTKPMGFLKMLFGSLILGSFIYVTLISITTFAIESERDGLFTEYDPYYENSSGLALILLIFPTIFFCLIPFCIYDLIPFIFNGFFVIWENFQEPPGKAWYLSILGCSCALACNLMITTYLFKRDNNGLWEDIKPYLTTCNEKFMGLQLPNILCGKCDLKFGVGRIYIKNFQIFAGIVSMVVFFFSIIYILGMRHRPRNQYKTRLRSLVVEEFSGLFSKLSENDLTQSALHIHNLMQENDNVMARMIQKKNGEIFSNFKYLDLLVPPQGVQLHLFLHFVHFILVTNEFLGVNQGPKEPHIGNFLMRFQQIMAILRMPRKENSLDIKRRRWSLLLDFCIAALLTISISSMVFTFVKVKTCPRDFNEFRSYRGQCYKISNESYSWSEAQSDCKALNGYLLELYTQAEQTYLYEGIKSTKYVDKIRFWIGASDHLLSKQFLWNKTSQPPKHQVTNWPTGFPSGNTSALTCIMLLNDMEFPWINVECIEESHYICKTELFSIAETVLAYDQDRLSGADSLNASYGVKWLIPWAFQVYGGSTRLTVIEQDTQLTWDEARSVCTNNSMDLVSIDSKAKFEFVKRQYLNYLEDRLKDNTLFWLQAVRPAKASFQHRLEWINENLMSEIEEEERKKERDRKCLAVTVCHWWCFGVDTTFLLLPCNETPVPDNKYVLCESSNLKYKCHHDHDCNQRASCFKGSCYCESGFAGNGRYCFDVNECLTISEKGAFLALPLTIHSCGLSKCRNEIGTHSCLPSDP